MIYKIVSQEDITPDFQNEITELYKQLNKSITQLPIKDILNQNTNTTIVICKDNKNIIGLAMIATYRVISGYKGMIEDVIVHENYRGKGIGKELINKLLSEASNMKLTEVLLFSGHHRKPAIALYKSLGFILKNSGLYTLKIPSST